MSDNKPKFACIRFLDQKNKTYLRSIYAIKNFKHSKDHIRPRDANDYQEKEYYFIYWCDCERRGDCHGDGMCNKLEINNNSKYFKGYITCLGGLVSYYIYDKPSWSHLEDDQKDFLISGSTETLSSQIRDLRRMKCDVPLE